MNQLIRSWRPSRTTAVVVHRKDFTEGVELTDDRHTSTDHGDLPRQGGGALLRKGDRTVGVTYVVHTFENAMTRGPAPTTSRDSGGYGPSTSASIRSATPRLILSAGAYE